MLTYVLSSLRGKPSPDGQPRFLEAAAKSSLVRALPPPSWTPEHVIPEPNNSIHLLVWHRKRNVVIYVNHLAQWLTFGRCAVNSEYF